MKTVITKKELHVPLDVLIEVSDVLLENEIANTIIGTESGEDEIVIEVEYEKEQRNCIHQVEDIISDYQEGDEDDNENEGENEE